MPQERLELSHLSVRAPKARVYTNFTTAAYDLVFARVSNYTPKVKTPPFMKGGVESKFCITYGLRDPRLFPPRKPPRSLPRGRGPRSSRGG